MKEEKKERAEDIKSWTAVEAVANPSEAALLAGFLQSHEIPARVVDQSFHQTPTSGEDLTLIEVAVPTARLDEARRVLQTCERQYESSKKGSDTVLTDEGPAEIDPDEGR